MTSPDRNLLDRIDEAWDAYLSGEQPSSGASIHEFNQPIDALHRMESPVQASDEFRQRLRTQLFGEATGRHVHSTDFGFDAVAEPSFAASSHDDGFRTRRWWVSHAGELAAIILILVVIIAAVAIFSDGWGSSQPAATDDQEEVSPTPTPAVEQSPVFPDDIDVLTFDEAQAATPFEIVMPDFLPNGYELAGIVVESAPPLPEGALMPVDGDDAVLAYFLLASDSTERPGLHLYQTNAQVPHQDFTSFVAVPGGRNDSEHPIGELDRQVRRIDDQGVFRTVLGTGEGNQMLYYQWYQDHLTMWMQVIGEPDDPEYVRALSGIADTDLERMIESILAQRRDDILPPFGGLPGFDDSRNLHRGLTFEQAQEITPFQVIDPRGILDNYELTGVNVSGPPELDRGDGEGPQPVGTRYMADFFFQSQEVAGRGFQLSQINHQLSPPAASEEPGSAVDPDGEPVEIETPERIDEEIEIDGLRVIRTVQRHGNGNELLVYTWHQDGVGLMLIGVTRVGEDDPRGEVEAVPPEDLERFVSALIELRRSDEMP